MTSHARSRQRIQPTPPRQLRRNGMPPDPASCSLMRDCASRIFPLSGATLSAIFPKMSEMKDRGLRGTYPPSVMVKVRGRFSLPR
nr:MAG TPA: hypothetical protein [Caudoviricetes sp.]